MEQASFINVDLELGSDEDLSCIEEELDSRVFVLQSGSVGGVSVLNFECTLNGDGPDAVIEELMSLIESLSPKSKELLNRCHKRVLDIGYDSGSEGILNNTIPISTLERLIKNGFSISISVYPIDDIEI